MHKHLTCWHFLNCYTYWDRHGERSEFTIHRASSPTDDIANGTSTMIGDLIAGYVRRDVSMNDYADEVDEQSSFHEIEKRMKLMEDNEK